MKKDIIGSILLFLLFALLIIAGIISYQSIDWNVLKKIENQKLILPTPIVTTSNTSTSSISPTNNPQK